MSEQINTALCGRCCREVFHLSLEERKKYAMTLKEFVHYQCLECGIHLYYDSKMWHKSRYFQYIEALQNDDRSKKPFVFNSGLVF